MDGLDLHPAFVRIARRKHPDGRFIVADMRDFHLPGRYDAITSLFSSIGYLLTVDDVTRALACLREHLASGGIALVEPWFPPGVLEHGRVTRETAEASGVRVERVSRTEVDGRLSRLHFEYTVTDAGGVRHAREVHELGLFTPQEMTRAFESAGLGVEHDGQGPSGRGLYVARIPG